MTEFLIFYENQLFSIPDNHLILSNFLGNAGCAFVEGLVTNQENPQDSNDYQLILPIVNLMSYSESKNATPQARTRRFVWSAADKLKPEVCAQSWRRLRLVCKQIFNTQHPIGLSLLHINPTQLTTTPPPIIPTTTIQATVEKKTITKTNVDDRTETNTTQTSGKETKLESPQSTTTEKSESGSVENVTKSNKKKIVVPLLDGEENISQDSSTSQVTHVIIRRGTCFVHKHTHTHSLSTSQ